MKILLIDVYNYNKGGAETVCFNTGKLLEEHGHQVVYFTLRWDKNNPSPYSGYFPESKETRKGLLKQVKNVVNYFYHFEAAKKIEQLIKHEKPDIAHIHLIWGQITASILPVLKKHQIPILFTVHDYRMVCPAYVFRNGSGRICEDCKGKYFYKCFVHTCCKGSKVLSAVMASEQYFRNVFFNPSKYIDGLLYVSNFARDIHERYMPALKDIPKITLYNFCTSIARIPKAMPKERYFLYFGRLSSEKGVKTLLKAFRDLPNCRLDVVGTGPEEKALKKYAHISCMNNVNFLGYKRGKELQDLVTNAFFVLVPSECYENNPMSIIEAYAVGTPVIGAKIGGIPEIILEGNTGYQFISGDVQTLKDKVMLADSVSAKDYVHLSSETLNFAHGNLSLDRYYLKLISFYNQFIKK
jgi:hypothetical protein